MIGSLLLLLCTVYKFIQCSSFVPQAYGLNPNYAKSVNSKYTFTFTATKDFSRDFSLRIVFPGQFTLTPPSGCSLLINSVASSTVQCSLNQSTNSIVLDNISNSGVVSSFEVSFNTSTARYSGSSNIEFHYYDAATNTLINQQTNFVSMTITNAEMSCSVQSSASQTGSDTNYSITYSPSVVIEKDSIVQVQLEPWGPYSQSNFVTTNTATICNGECSLTLPSSIGYTSEILTYSRLYASADGSGQTLLMASARNPASTQQISISVVVSAFISGTSQKPYMNCQTTFSVSQASPFQGISFTTDNPSNQIRVSNIVTLIMSLSNPISITSYIRINPSILPLSYQYYRYNQGTQPSEKVTTDGTMLLGNLTLQTTRSPLALMLKNFTLVNPPYANKPVSLTITTEQYIDDVYYLINSGSVSVIASPSTITESGIANASSSINVVTSYSIWFNIINSLVSTSFVIVGFPTAVDLQSASCQLLNYPSLCQIVNQTHLQVHINTAITADSNLSIDVSDVRNPPTTTQTNSITITTYYQDEQSIVDTLSQGLTLTATPVPLNSVSISPSTWEVGALSVYTLRIQIENPLPMGSQFTVKIPTQSYETTIPNIDSVDVGGTVATGCLKNEISDLYFRLSDCFPGSVTASTIITVVISNLRNPKSTKPTSSWQVETFFQNRLMEYMKTGITTQMNETASLMNFIIHSTTSIVNQNNVYTFQANFRFSHYSGDRIIITFPDEVLIGAGHQCQSETIGTTVSCTQTTAQVLQITFDIDNGTSISILQFTISDITNSWYAGQVLFSVITTTNDTSFYFVENGTQTVDFFPGTLPATSSNERIILLSQSIIQLQISRPFALSRVLDTSRLALTIAVPFMNMQPIADTCSVSVLGATCTLDQNSSTYTVREFGDFSSPIDMTFNASTQYFDTSSPFSLQLRYDSDIIARNSNLTISRYCTPPCKQCTASKTECLSCLPKPHTNNNTYMPDNSACLASCPSAYYLSSTTGYCEGCDQTACYECSINQTQCTSCHTNKYLHQSRCVATCPTEYYADDGECLSCVAPCHTCTSVNFCLSCDPNYFLDTDNECVLECKDSRYLGVGGLCKRCTNDCQSCEGSLSNCTSCDSPNYLLSENQCTRTCSSGYYNNANSTCRKCVSPCLTCSTETICESCVSDHYLYDNKTCTDSCPPGTIAMVNVCQNCADECSMCSITQDNCTSCSGSLLYYHYRCYSSCPNLTYPYQGSCQTCIDPCVTCIDTPQLCLSCTPPLYLLNNSCVSQCPINSYYQDSQFMKCLQCIDNCISCQSSVTCSICSSAYYLSEGACVSQCPPSKPIIISRECESCMEECATCEGKQDNCTSCTVYYYKYEYTCVSECPIAYYSNVVTYECESGLSSKIVFFPVLISALVVLGLVIISKCIAPNTSLITSFAALMSPLELAIWIFLVSLISQDIKEPDVDYVLPTAMLGLALAGWPVINIVFFFVNKSRAHHDEYLKQWASANVNFGVMRILEIVSFLFGCKFYRLLYSRLLNSNCLSAAFKLRQNVFPVANVFTILILILCEIPVIVCCFSLIYFKTLKDQMFYTAVEGLVVTVISIIAALIDIYKSEKFFEQTEFCKIKQYVEKVKDSSFNKLEEGFDISQEEGSVDAERYVSTIGGKLVYSKGDPSSIKDNLYFEQEESEKRTELDDSTKKETDGGSKKKLGSDSVKTAKINIFDPIREQEAEYYDQEMHDESEAYTQAQKCKKQPKVKTNESESETQENFRKAEMGLDEPFDDQKSLISERGRKRRWNDMMKKRKQLVQKISNRQHHQSILHLEDLQEDEDEDIEEIDLQNEQIQTKKKRRRRKKKANFSSNKELEQIYLQRLTEKKKSTKDFFMDKSLKYDF